MNLPRSILLATVRGDLDFKIQKPTQLLTGESEGYTVATKEKDIAISDYPLLQTEFLYASKKGTAD